MILCPQCQTHNDGGSVRCAGCGASLDGDGGGIGSDPYVGRQLGERFFLQSFLGSGEIGLVYRGTDVTTDQEVAVKIIHPDVAASIGDRLLRSAVAISQVRHPKIAAVHAAARESDGTLYVATEFMRGQTLKQLLEHNGPLGPRRAADIIFQLASALAPIHKVGRPHANLKPENVFLVERDGSADFVRVTDVGVPDLFGVRKTTQGPTIIGSPKYFSPEQAQGQAATVLSDQFTLGIIAYQLLTGALPFFGATPDQLLAAIAAGTPTPIARRTPGIQLPPKLEQIIAKCLSKSPSERFADLRALATDVASVIKSTQPEVAPPRKKGFVQASTVMADPGMIGTLQAASDDEEDEDGDRTRAGESPWGDDTTGQHTPISTDATPAVSTPISMITTTRPSQPQPQGPSGGGRPRPPTQNDMMNLPPPLMVTGAMDSEDLHAALSQATAALGRGGAATPPPRRNNSFDDDLQAALMAAAADVGDAGSQPVGGARRSSPPDPFSDANPNALNATPAGSAAAMASAPAARPSAPGGVRLTHDIMSAIDEELEDGSVNTHSHSNGAPAAPLSTMDDLKDFSRPTDAVAAPRAPRIQQSGNGKKIAAAALLLVLGGGGGAYFFLMDDSGSANVRPQAAGADVAAAPPTASIPAIPTVPSAPAAGTQVAGQPSAPATEAPSAASDEPAVVKAERERREAEAKRLAGAVPGSAVAATGLQAKLTSEPEGATVLHGDKKLGITPLDVDVEAGGQQKYSLKLEGYETATVTVEPGGMTPGEPMPINTKLIAGAMAKVEKPVRGNGGDEAEPKSAPAGGAEGQKPQPKPQPKPQAKPQPKPPVKKPPVKKPATDVEDPFAE